MIQNRDKERKSDRILVLGAMEGKTPKNTLGIGSVRDAPEAFYAHKDPQSCLWEFRQRGGILHGPLRQKFTSFKKLRQFADEYFGRRNMVIKEVKD